MAQILVTGATGFIGWHLVKALRARGDEVACLTRKTSNLSRLEPLGIARVLGDLEDPASLKAAAAGKDVVFHVAGCIQALRADAMHRVNAEGTGHIAQACAEQSSPPVLVIVSSLAASGPSTPDRPRVETDPPSPISGYGRSKLAGEMAAQCFAHAAPISVVRPPIVLGEGDRTGLEMFKSVLQWGIHVAPSRRPHRYSVIHAGDLARALLLVAERGERMDARQNEGTGCYHVTADEQPTYAELGTMIAEAGGRRVRVIRVGPAAVFVAVCGSELAARVRRRAAYLNWDKMREIFAGSWTCSAQKARDGLGFRIETPLAERFRQTIEWYRQNGWIY
jgi:nucleoside-diphosphate-sugar epimerase